MARPSRHPFAAPITVLAVLGSLGLAACGGAAESPAPAEAPAAEATQADAVAMGGMTEAAPAAEEAIGTTEEATPAMESGAAPDAAMPAPAKLDLNTASGEAFMAAIPGLGDRMVREFEEYRPYVSIEQFRREMAKYVEDDQIAEYELYVYVPIDPNASDEATLQQLPGVDAAIAAQLVAARPFASTATFLEALAGLVALEDAAQAPQYLVQP